MKVSWIVCLSVVATVSAGGTAWPGAIPVAGPATPALAHLAPVAYAAPAFAAPAYKTLLAAPVSKGFAYSSTQYINSLPLPYQFASYPQFAYRVPHYSAFSPIVAGYPVGDPFISQDSFIYPSPSQPPSLPGSGFPINIPSIPSPQPTGDSDTTVIDSANSGDSNGLFTNNQQTQTPAPAASGPQNPQFPPGSTLPGFLPNQGANSPSFPQIQFPQVSIPNFPQFPQFPTNPIFPQPPASPAPEAPASSTVAPSFPGAESNDRGLNDEDTISIDSA